MICSVKSPKDTESPHSPLNYPRYVPSKPKSVYSASIRKKVLSFGRKKLAGVGSGLGAGTSFLLTEEEKKGTIKTALPCSPLRALSCQAV